MSDTPKVYVVCLASYNAGNTYGEWIDAIDADELHEGIQDMLEASSEQGEEWAIHDCDNFHGLNVGEYDSYDMIAEIGRLIEKYGAAFAALADNIGIEHATEEGFEDAYCGEWSSETAYAENLFDDCYDVPTDIANYIDYEAFTNDIFMGDYYSVICPGGVFVFRNI